MVEEQHYRNAVVVVVPVERQHYRTAAGGKAIKMWWPGAGSWLAGDGNVGGSIIKVTNLTGAN